MFEKLGHLIAKRKKPILALFLLSTIFAGVVGSQVFSRFDTGGYMGVIVMMPVFAQV